MTPTEFKAYSDTVIRSALVMGALAFFWRAMELAYTMTNDTLFISLASGGAMTIMLSIYAFWFGNSHKSPPPPDTSTITQTTTDTTK